MPIYSPDMPKRLPTRDLLHGLMSSVLTALRFWLHYTLVWIAWLLVVPLTAARIYKCLFAMSFSSLLSLPLDILSTENVTQDGLYGFLIVISTLCFFIAIVWLREQIIHGGAPDWLEPPVRQLADRANNNIPGQRAPPVPLVGGAREGEAPLAEGEELGDEDQPMIEENGNDIAQQVAAANDAAGDRAAAPRAENAGGGNDWRGVDLHAIARQAAGLNAADEDDGGANWNQDWDRGEDITWQRLLGLDGSLVFLEHMFWVLSLNTLFMFVFALLPFHIGECVCSIAGVLPYLDDFEFRGPLVALLGYVVVAFGIMTLYTLCQGSGFRKARRCLGLCYLIIKVSLLAIIEVGVFPMICGAWLNICSMDLFGNNLGLLQANLRAAPATNAFLHWLIGMIYVYYFAFFVLLLREVVRPGVLWFLQNINDPEFHPIQEMIQLGVILHVRRFIVSLVIFGTAILLKVWLPLRLMKKFTPSLLPYNISMQHADLPTTEISMELIILQVVLPALLEQGYTKQFVKWCVRLWCKGVSYLLGIGSYLLGDSLDDEEVAEDPQEPQNAPRDLAAVHQALINANIASAHQPYVRPTYFALRIFLLLILVCLTLTVCSLVVLTLPVTVGKFITGLLMPNVRLHEFYTVGAGLYVCWLVIRGVSLAKTWLPKGWHTIWLSLKNSVILAAKASTACALLLGLIPLLLGIHFDLIIIIPLRVPVDATPVMYPFHDWALGVLHTKIIGALTLMGPNWWLKNALDQVYQDGLRQMNLTRIIRDIVVPCVAVLGLSLSLPYIFVYSCLSRFLTPDIVHLVQRRIYPTLLVTIMLSWYAVFQWKQFRRLYEHIKNDKYLVGKRLVNYERQQQAAQNAANKGAAAGPQ